jgi:thioredoxin 1
MRRSPILLLSALTIALTANETPAKPPSNARLELSVQRMSCEGCARQIESALRRQDGVRFAKVDFKAARLVLEYAPEKTSLQKIAAVIASLGYRTNPGETAGAWGNCPPGADVIVSRAGEDADVERSVAAGKVTIVDFYADWCGPCKALDRRLAELTAQHHDHLAIPKVNVDSWNTPIVKRYVARVAYLPHVRVFDARGRMVAALSGSEVGKLDEVVTKLVGSVSSAP